jgi:hypothetical protein
MKTVLLIHRMRVARKLLPPTILNYADFVWWKLRGSPARTPHLVKQRTVAAYAQRYGLRTLVETGTYYGDMVAAMRKRFDRIYSVEFDPELAGAAAKKFGRFLNIQILRGDSQVLVPSLVHHLSEPALFWLDAGYYGWAGEQRTRERLDVELQAILSAPQPHIVLIDDAQGFDGRNGAPTVADFSRQIETTFPQHRVEVAQQIFRIRPCSEPA